MAGAEHEQLVVRPYQSVYATRMCAGRARDWPLLSTQFAANGVTVVQLGIELGARVPKTVVVAGAATAAGGDQEQDRG